MDHGFGAAAGVRAGADLDAGEYRAVRRAPRVRPLAARLPCPSSLARPARPHSRRGRRPAGAADAVRVPGRHRHRHRRARVRGPGRGRLSRPDLTPDGNCHRPARSSSAASESTLCRGEAGERSRRGGDRDRGTARLRLLSRRIVRHRRPERHGRARGRGRALRRDRNPAPGAHPGGRRPLPEANSRRRSGPGARPGSARNSSRSRPRALRPRDARPYLRRRRRLVVRRLEHGRRSDVRAAGGPVAPQARRGGSCNRGTRRGGTGRAGRAGASRRRGRGRTAGSRASHRTNRVPSGSDRSSVTGRVPRRGRARRSGASCPCAGSHHGRDRAWGHDRRAAARRRRRFRAVGS